MTKTFCDCCGVEIGPDFAVYVSVVHHWLGGDIVPSIFLEDIRRVFCMKCSNKIVMPEAKNEH